MCNHITQTFFFNVRKLVKFLALIFKRDLYSS